VPVITGAVIAADQATKTWAVRALAAGPRHIVGPVRLELTRNPGGAFSTLTGATPVLAVLAIGLTFVVVRMVRQARDPWTSAALALVLGGALGNLSDRVLRSPGFLRGQVIDFVRAASWWPTFNVADAAITVGALWLLLRGLRAP
jgi:signal peptidase II